MDRQLYEKARSIDYELGHIRAGIEQLNSGCSVFGINEWAQRIIDRETLQKIRKEADQKVLELLTAKAAHLSAQFVKL